MKKDFIQNSLASLEYYYINAYALIFIYSVWIVVEEHSHWIV